jgi:hypothetical protein
VYKKIYIDPYSKENSLRDIVNITKVSKSSIVENIPMGAIAIEVETSDYDVVVELLKECGLKFREENLARNKKD